MKKKIKNLTNNGIESICNKYPSCLGCPLYIPCDTSCKDGYPSNYGEEEVEVDD